MATHLELARAICASVVDTTTQDVDAAVNARVQSVLGCYLASLDGFTLLATLTEIVAAGKSRLNEDPSLLAAFNVAKVNHGFAPASGFVGPKPAAPLVTQEPKQAPKKVKDKAKSKDKAKPKDKKGKSAKSRKK